MPSYLQYRPRRVEMTMADQHHFDVDSGRRNTHDPAGDAFVETNLRRVFSIVYRILGNVEDAQDVTQDVFIKVLQRGEQLRDLDKAAHWLSRIASNAAIDHLRRKKRVNWLELDETVERTLPAGMENAEERLLRRECRDELEEVLAQLTPRERMALVLRDVEDLPAEEVALRLNCGKATVRSHIANARVKFKKLMGGKP